jgi:hypothetical protein
MTDAPNPPSRPASKWFALLIVWAIGLIVWGLYLIAMVYAFFRLMGPSAK